MPFPVGKAIEALKSRPLRLAMYTAEGEELAALQRAFPACFSPDASTIRVPASVIREKARAVSAEGGGGPSSDLCANWWAEAAQNMGIPLAFEWTFEGENIPPEVWKQLEGKPVNEPQTVSYLGETLLIVGAFLSDGPPSAKRDVFEGEAKYYDASAVLARFIDLDA